MLVDHPTRRRVITILGATAAASLVDRAHAAIDLESRGFEWQGFEWQGLAMGADARITLCGVDHGTARAAVAVAVAEIERLERALSLFRSDSEICRLNREKLLRAPTGDMRRALTLALAIAETTNGLFDPTVQALWEAHVDWFAAFPDSGLPSDHVLTAARATVDWRKIAVNPDAICLGRTQRITLNGLGQGYVTDRVADLLRARGFEHVLVDLGEQRALGPQPDGRPWSVARRDAVPLLLRDGALATSEGAGCVLGAGGAAHHLFDPRSGRSAAHWRRIIVHHASAAIADALSTTLYAAGRDEIAPLLGRFPGTTVWATDRDGVERRLAATTD